jgi:hypothetical protein
MLKDFFVRASRLQLFHGIDQINLGMVGLHENATVEQKDILVPELTSWLARVVSPNPIRYTQLTTGGWWCLNASRAIISG